MWRSDSTVGWQPVGLRALRGYDFAYLIGLDVHL
jgi:hypothetical protein